MKYMCTVILSLSCCLIFSLLSMPESDYVLCQATGRFKEMRVAQIRYLDMSRLSPDEMHAFRVLARKIFCKEIASAGCFSQANRRKYEVMYQKISQVDEKNYL